MDDAEIERRLQTVFESVFDDDEIALRHDMTADDIDGWDSASHIMLIVAAEKEFGMRFSLKELDTLYSVGDMIAVIRSKGR